MEFASRLSALPTVSSLLENANVLYQGQKDRHQHLGKVTDFVLSSAVSASTAVLQTSLGAALDGCACSQLDKIEKSFPVVTEPPSKIVQKGIEQVTKVALHVAKNPLARASLSSGTYVVGMTEKVLDHYRPTEADVAFEEIMKAETEEHAPDTETAELDAFVRESRLALRKFDVSARSLCNRGLSGVQERLNTVGNILEQLKAMKEGVVDQCQASALRISDMTQFYMVELLRRGVSLGEGTNYTDEELAGLSLDRKFVILGGYCTSILASVATRIGSLPFGYLPSPGDSTVFVKTYSDFLTFLDSWKDNLAQAGSIKDISVNLIDQGIFYVKQASSFVYEMEEKVRSSLTERCAFEAQRAYKGPFKGFISHFQHQQRGEDDEPII